MKDFAFLLIICVGIIIGVGGYLLPGSTHSIFRRTIEVHPPDPPAPKTKLEKEKEAGVPASTKPGKHQRASKAAEVEDQKIVLETIVNPAAPTLLAAATPKPAQVPSYGEVMLGSERSHLLDNFGFPAITASTEDRGHLFETYVYHASRKQTIVKLEDGKVSAVHLR
jgi:hypothetical protein